MDNQTELPKRKRTRLEHYDYSSPGAYFVTICTQGRKCILSDIAVGADALGGPRVKLTHIGEVVEKYLLSTEQIPNVHLDQYVIMPNHIHLILVVESGNGPPGASAPTGAAIPNAVGALKRLVHRELGQTIFQRSFHDHIIRNEQDYREIWNCIDGNPGKWADDCLYPDKP